MTRALRFAPPLSIAAAAAVLAASWNRLPERWIVHWGPGGVPDGWAGRTAGGVFGPLALAAGLWLLHEAILAIVRVASPKTPALAPVRDATATFVRLVGLAVTASISVIAVLLPLEAVPSPGVLAGGLVAAVGVALCAGMVAVSRAVVQARAAGATELAGYRGAFYYAKDDPRIWVPKLLGMGWTLNLAHPVSWVIFALLVAVPLAVVAAVAASR